LDVDGAACVDVAAYDLEGVGFDYGGEGGAHAEVCAVFLEECFLLSLASVVHSIS